MNRQLEYTQTYKDTLSAVVSIIDREWGKRYTDNFLNQLDSAVEKIRKHPYLCQALDINSKYRRYVISKQTSLVYEVNDVKITLLYLYDNRQEPFLDR